MLRFLRTLAVFSLPLAALFALLEWRMRRVPTSFAIQRAVVQERASTAEVLVVGSSHELNGFYPPAFGCPSINLANASQSLELGAQLALHEELPKLRQVVLGLSHFSFGYRLGQSPEKWRLGFYQHYFGVREQHEAVHLPQLQDFSVAALYDPGQAWYVVHHPDVAGSKDEGGWMPTGGIAGMENLQDEGAAIRRVAQHESSIDDALRPADVAAVRAMIQALEQRGVHVVLAFFPLQELYRRHLSTEVLRKNAADLARMQEGTQARVLDYREDPRFSDADFVNFDHLTLPGARKLTGILSKELGCP